MTRFAPFTRDYYIPKGSVKIADRNSDGVVYVYRSAKDRPAAMAFHGKSVKPDWHHSFANETARESKIKAHFEGQRRVATWRAERRAERKQPHGFEVGHILYASWGYDQTNFDFYQVTRIIGVHTVEIRAVNQIAADTGNETWMTGKCLPKLKAIAPQTVATRYWKAWRDQWAREGYSLRRIAAVECPEQGAHIRRELAL